MGTPEEDFEEFWNIGRKKGKGDARRKYYLARKKAPKETIHAKYQEYIDERIASGDYPQFTKHPATWLHGEGWTDEADRQIRICPQRNAAEQRIDGARAELARSALGDLFTTRH